MKMENDFSRNEVPEPTQEKVLPDHAEVDEADQAENAEAAKNLVEKGFATDTVEAGKFLQKLKETLEASEEIKKELSGFQDALLMVVSEAEAQLDEIEKDMEGSFADRAEVYREIAEKLSANFDQMLESKKQAQNPEKGNFAFRLGRWVSKNQKAMVAFSVFAAALRVGGGVAHAFDGGHDSVDTLSHDYLPHYDETGGHEVSENEQPQENAATHDFEHVNNLISHEVASESQTDQVDNHTQIEQTLASINEAKLDSNHVVADFAHGTAQGNFDLEHLQKDLQEKGSVQFSVQSYTEVHEGQLQESMLSVQQVDGAHAGQEHETAENINITAEGTTPENAVMMAINELNDFAGVHVEGGTETQNAMLESDTVVSAGSNSLDIQSVEVTAHAIDDGNGNQSTIYEAHLTGRGI